MIITGLKKGDRVIIYQGINILYETASETLMGGDLVIEPDINNEDEVIITVRHPDHKQIRVFAQASIAQINLNKE